MLKKLFFYFCFVLCFNLTSQQCFAQEQDSVVVMIDTVQKKEEKKPLIYFINGNNYKTPNNWFCGGIGLGYKLNKTQKFSAPVSASFNFHVKNNNYLQVGFMRSEIGGLFNASNNFLSDSTKRNIFLNDIHIGIGRRKETVKNNIAGFVCVSRATGQLSDTTRFVNYGLYSEIHYIHKLFFDVGVGAALFGSYSKAYQMVGLRLEFYFSNALRKQKK